MTMIDNYNVFASIYPGMGQPTGRFSPGISKQMRVLPLRHFPAFWQIWLLVHRREHLGVYCQWGEYFFPSCNILRCFLWLSFFLTYKSRFAFNSNWYPTVTFRLSLKDPYYIPHLVHPSISTFLISFYSPFKKETSCLTSPSLASSLPSCSLHSFSLHPSTPPPFILSTRFLPVVVSIHHMVEWEVRLYIQHQTVYAGRRVWTLHTDGLGWELRARLCRQLLSHHHRMGPHRIHRLL